MTRTEAIECVALIEAIWLPFELFFYTDEEVIEAISDYSVDAVKRALRAYARILDAAPSLWQIQNLASWYDEGRWMHEEAELTLPMERDN